MERLETAPSITQFEQSISATQNLEQFSKILKDPVYEGRDFIDKFLTNPSENNLIASSIPSLSSLNKKLVAVKYFNSFPCQSLYTILSITSFVSLFVFFNIPVFVGSTVVFTALYTVHRTLNNQIKLTAEDVISQINEALPRFKEWIKFFSAIDDKVTLLLQRVSQPGNYTRERSLEEEGEEGSLLPPVPPIAPPQNFRETLDALDDFIQETTCEVTSFFIKEIHEIVKNQLPIGQSKLEDQKNLCSQIRDEQRFCFHPVDLTIAAVQRRFFA